MGRPRGLRVFYAFRDSSERRAALAHPPGGPERYRLFGLDELAQRGARARHNLERPGPPPAWSRAVSGALNGLLYRAGGYGGDFASVLASLRRVNAADVVFSFRRLINLKGNPSFLLSGIIDSTGMMELVLFLEEEFYIKVQPSRRPMGALSRMMGRRSVAGFMSRMRTASPFMRTMRKS